jgi:small subunit ribosomal protein S6
MTKDYELMVILKPLLPEDIKSGIDKRLKGLISKLEGKLTATDVWGKRHLAYQIESHEEGYYIIYKIELSTDKLDELNSELKLFNDILRFLIVREDNQ